MIAMDMIAKRRHIERLARMPAVSAQLGVFVAFPARRVHHVVVFLAAWEHRASTAGRTSRGWTTAMSGDVQREKIVDCAHVGAITQR